METSLRIAAPAKLNFHLRVYGRREDGFHGLRSIFQTVSLEDDIVIRSLKDTDSIAIDGAFDCPAESTTLHRAALAWRKATGVRAGLRLEARKRIPAGAGLGGGSSDAASVIRGLDALFGTGLSVREMAAIGAEVGSDVPFFLHAAAALVSGRGELVEPVEARDDLRIVVAWPGLPMSTPRAYGLLDSARPSDEGEADPGREKLLAAWGGPPAAWPFANSFTGPVVAAMPEIGSLIGRLRELGAEFAAMSGSGSATFAVFRGEAEADAAAAAIRADTASGRLPASCRAWSVRALARPPTLG